MESAVGCQEEKGKKKICIDVQMSMPLGDMLCSLALSLRDDLNSMKHIHTLNPNVRQEDGYGSIIRVIQELECFNILNLPSKQRYHCNFLMD